MDVPDPAPDLLTVAYARVSSHDQKADLDRQVARLAEWASLHGVRIHRYVREIGSGLNDRRKGLNELLGDPLVGTIVVEHRDRLTRFGFEQLQRTLASTGRQIQVLEDRELDDDLTRDVIEIMTCFSARLYGKRSAKNRAQRAADLLKADQAAS